MTFDIVCPSIKGSGPPKLNYSTEDCKRRQASRDEEFDHENPCADFKPEGCCKEFLKVWMMQMEK